MSDDIMAFLDAIQPVCTAGERIEARYISHHGEVRRRFYPAAASLAADTSRWAVEWNVYVGVALRDGTGGTAGNCTRVGALWADVDAKLWADEADPHAAAQAALQRFGRRLTATVDTTNGFHAYIGLTEPVDLRDPSRRATFEAINAAFARALCGQGRKPDAVHDPARVLRLPGTFNHKTTPPHPVELVSCDPAHHYSLGEVTAYLNAHYPWAMEPPRTMREPRASTMRDGETGGRPGDDYNSRGDLAGLLRTHGWRFLRECGHEEYWQRPGKTGVGISATLNYAGTGLFYVFSASASPLEPLTAYSPFAVYTLLEHGGDYTTATRALAREGYGEQPRRQTLSAPTARIPYPRHSIDVRMTTPIAPPVVYDYDEVPA